MGDIFLAMVNLARHLGVDAEAALRHANRRFEDRFRLMETAAEREGSHLGEESLERLRSVGRPPSASWQTAPRRLTEAWREVLNQLAARRMPV